jgi:hypothetical protein
MTLHTLADVRKLIEHVPRERRKLDTWRHVAGTLDKSVHGVVDPVNVSVALCLVLMLEGVECEPQ